MSDRWYIHQEGQALGPFTAADIREQLREGRIDPFDLVSRDGSSVRRELVEVDEIFATSKVVYADPAPFDGNTMELDSQKMVDEIVASEERLPGGVVGSEEEERQAARNAKTLPPGSVKKRKKARRDPKQYHLVDGKGRNLGPLSAGDIQQLYFKGRLDKHVKVVKNGSAAQVPIDKFVQVFAKSGAQRLPSPSGTGRQVSAPSASAVSAQQRIQSAPPSAPRMPNLKQRAAIQHHLVVGLLVVLGVALLGFAGWIFQQRGGFNLIGKKFSALSHTIQDLAKGTRYDEEEAPKPRPKKKPRKAVKPVEGKGKLPRGRVAKVEDDEEDEEEPAPKARKVRKKKGEPRERDRVRERDRDRKREPKRSEASEIERRKKFAQEQKRLQLAKAQDQQRARRNASAVSKVGYVPKAAPQVARAPVAAPAPAPAPPKPSGPTVGGLQNGQTVSGLGPMRYDKNAVAACEGACVISFFGAGGTVSGRFFKGAFGGTLMAKGGSAYLSGIVRKNGASVTILINGVN